VPELWWVSKHRNLLLTLLQENGLQQVH
jgi:hypothetical protein